MTQNEMLLILSEIEMLAKVKKIMIIVWAQNLSLVSQSIFVEKSNLWRTCIQEIQVFVFFQGLFRYSPEISRRKRMYQSLNISWF